MKYYIEELLPRKVAVDLQYIDDKSTLKDLKIPLPGSKGHGDRGRQQAASVGESEPAFPAGVTCLLFLTILSEKIRLFSFMGPWYILLAHPEDKALLESNLSAAVGKQNDGQG